MTDGAEANSEETPKWAAKPDLSAWSTKSEQGPSSNVTHAPAAPPMSPPAAPLPAAHMPPPVWPPQHHMPNFAPFAPPGMTPPPAWPPHSHMPMAPTQGYFPAPPPFGHPPHTEAPRPPTQGTESMPQVERPPGENTSTSRQPSHHAPQPQQQPPPPPPMEGPPGDHASGATRAPPLSHMSPPPPIPSLAAPPAPPAPQAPPPAPPAPQAPPAPPAERSYEDRESSHHSNFPESNHFSDNWRGTHDRDSHEKPATQFSGDSRQQSKEWSGSSKNDHKDWSSKEWSSKKWSSKDWSSKDGSSKDWSSKDGSPNDWSSKDGSSKNWSSKDGSSKDWSSKDGSSKDWSSKDWSSKDGSSKDGSSKDWSSKDKSSKDWSSKDWSSKDRSSKEWSSSDWSSKDPQTSTWDNTRSSYREGSREEPAWSRSDAHKMTPREVFPPEAHSLGLYDSSRRPHVVEPPPNLQHSAIDSRSSYREGSREEPAWSASDFVPKVVEPPNLQHSAMDSFEPRIVLPPAMSVSPQMHPHTERSFDSNKHHPLSPPTLKLPRIAEYYDPMEQEPAMSGKHAIPSPPPPTRSAAGESHFGKDETWEAGSHSQGPLSHLPPPPPRPTRQVENDNKSPQHGPQVVIPPAKAHQSEPQGLTSPKGHHTEPHIVIPPAKVQQAEPHVVIPPKLHQPSTEPPPNDGRPTVLMVAEKPSIADTIASALSNASATKRTTANRSPVFEFSDFFKGEPARFRVTSTHGHVYNLDFDKEYRDRERTNPADLFSAPVVRSHDWRSNMPEHLANEARGCHALVLWLDCDREGESICFEVIDNALPVMDTSRSWSGAFRERIFRAKFSCLSTSDLQRAMANLITPNENEAKSVSARQEIDLRLGVAFSRFLTQYFHQNFGEHMKTMIHDVTYGPCQMPTLWFCVHRHCQIEAFEPKPFWKLCAQVRMNQFDFVAELARGSVWDEEEATELHARLHQVWEVRVSSVSRRRNTLQKPLPLNTVTMLQQASQRVGISPGDAMYYAEQLYLRGILSYPRTETSRYPSGFDLNAVLYMLQRSDAPWSSIAARVADMRVRPREDGEDHGDHPPITPVRWASERQCGDANAWALYQMVCRHFLATLSQDCVLSETTVRLDLQGTEFEAVSSRRITDGGVDWCEAVGAQVDEKCAVDLAGLSQSDAGSAREVTLVKEATKPPSHLSESDLLGLMEKHGIGTDASMAQHISNVLKRGYAKVDGKERHLVPTGMGLALSHAYTLVDPALVRPTVRSSIENACNQVAKGQAKKEEVVSNAVSIFERKFRHFSNRVDRVPAMLSVAYKRETPQSAAQWESAAKATASISLDDLLKARESAEIGGEDIAQGKDKLRTGSVVLINGLKGAAELNGQKGTCEQLDAATGRWHVRLSSGIIKALKPENLQVTVYSELKVGVQVRLHSLKGAAHLNGQLGTCESWDASASRWHVRLQSGEARALKAENLSVATGAEEVGTKRSRPEESVDEEPESKRLHADECDRGTLKKRIFQCCDKDGDGFLNKDEMYALAVLSGFDGSADKWRIEYMGYCVGCTANTAKGIPLAGVSDLLDDISEDGCYCSDEQLRDFLKSHQ